MGRGRAGKGVVRADQVAAVLPSDPRGPDQGRPAPAALYRPGLLKRIAATGDPAALKARLVAEIRAEGFDVARVVPPEAALPAGDRLRAFVAEGRNGTMV